MAETAAYPYATHLDIKFDPLTLIDVSSLAKTVTDQWYNQTLCKVNESVIRLGVMQGEYHWHKHDNDDEFFFVLSGRFIIDLEGHSIELLPNQGFTVPKGVLHCTRAPKRSMILMVETAAIVQGTSTNRKAVDDYAALASRLSIRLRSASKSIGLVSSASAPPAKAFRSVSALGRIGDT